MKSFWPCLKFGWGISWQCTLFNAHHINFKYFWFFPKEKLISKWWLGNLLALSKASDIFYCPSGPLSITSSLTCGYVPQSPSSEGYSPSLLSSLTPSKHVSLDCITPVISDIWFPSTDCQLQTLVWLPISLIAFETKIN